MTTSKLGNFLISCVSRTNTTDAGGINFLTFVLSMKNPLSLLEYSNLYSTVHCIHNAQSQHIAECMLNFAKCTLYIVENMYLKYNCTKSQYSMCLWRQCPCTVQIISVRVDCKIREPLDPKMPQFLWVINLQ